MKTIIIEDAHGNHIEVEASEAVAVYIKDNDRYIASLHDKDQRYFRLIHFDKRAWENMKGLTTGYSAEDECLCVPEEQAAMEWMDYQRRLAWCRRMLYRLQDACTPTQWRRYKLHKAFGYTIREIAQIERRDVASIVESIRGVERKIKKIF